MSKHPWAEIMSKHPQGEITSKRLQTEITSRHPQGENLQVHVRMSFGVQAFLVIFHRNNTCKTPAFNAAA